MKPSHATIAVAAAAAWGCVEPTPPAKLPAPPYVAVLSGQMPRPLDQVARHGWVVVQPVKGSAHRYEYGGGGRGSDGDPFSDFAAGDVMVHGVFRGTEAEIAAKDACLREAAQAFHQQYPNYFPIPGPNSNTFVAYVDRRCGLGIELPATAIGRDYVGPIGADLTEARTGIQLGSFPVGLRLGLREGVEVHFFGLPLGVHFWPPGINVPVNPGRIGFASDEHVSRPFDAEGERDVPDHAARKGAASVRMFAGAWATVDRERALGLEGQGLVGLSGRAVYPGRWGYAVGLDLEAGVGVPDGFAYGARLFPVGVGVLLSQTGYLALFSGIGASGVTARVPSGLELPQELRLEIDVGPRARLAMYGRGTFVALQPLRRQGKMGFGETTFGIAARFGRTVGFREGSVGSGFFFGLERRELVETAMVGLVLGTEIDAGDHRGR